MLVLGNPMRAFFVCNGLRSRYGLLVLIFIVLNDGAAQSTVCVCCPQAEDAANVTTHTALVSIQDATFMGFFLQRVVIGCHAGAAHDTSEQTAMQRADTWSFAPSSTDADVVRMGIILQLRPLPWREVGYVQRWSGCVPSFHRRLAQDLRHNVRT